MREIIQIGVGQAGVNMCCQTINQLENEGAKDSEIFLAEGLVGDRKPRAVLIDCDMDMPSNVRRLFPNLEIDPDDMICGKEDSASYAFRAHYTLGNNILETSKESIRKQFEISDRP
jgi:tubulin alpha